MVVCTCRRGPRAHVQVLQCLLWTLHRQQTEKDSSSDVLQMSGQSGRHTKWMWENEECPTEKDRIDTRWQHSPTIREGTADPRYITHGDDGNRRDILLTLAKVRELIIRKQQSEEGVATVWLTTAEMGFSLTDEPNEILCPKDIREGKVSDRYLAPAISRFVTSTLAEVGGGAERDQQAKDV
jgi:hypothetical protein